MHLNKAYIELNLTIVEVYDALNDKALKKLEFPSIHQLAHSSMIKNLIKQLKEELENAKVVEKVEDSETGNLFAEEG